MNAEVRELMEKEVAHAAELIARGTGFDNLADAAECLTRAANRIAPEGHRVRFQRDEWSPSER